MIVEVDAGLAPDGETVVDAGGAYVAPGFIDCHTHYDPSVWWDPLVDPMPQHGVTTVVTGNCSLSLTPVRAADRLAASDVFGFIEDIPVDAFTTGIPWSWESYAEWRDALRGARHRGERGRARRTLQPSRLRDGRRRVDARRHRRGARPDRGGAGRLAGGGCARVVDVVRRPGPSRSSGAESRRRRRRTSRAHRGARRRARSRTRAGVPALDQGARSSARRHRPRGALVWRRGRRLHVEPAGREQPRPVARRADHRAGARAPRRRVPRRTGRCRRVRSTCT